jgi:hypothetical protein
VECQCSCREKLASWNLQLKSALARAGRRVDLYIATAVALINVSYVRFRGYTVIQTYIAPKPSATLRANFFLMFICSLDRMKAG